MSITEEHLFALLARQDKAILFKLLHDAWTVSKEAKRREIFDEWIWRSKRENLTAEAHVREVEIFYADSFRGVYFAPFDMDSKNFRHIPEKTACWFNTIGDLLDMTCILAEEGHGQIATECFDKLFDLIDNISEDIVFSAEAGEWMITARYDYRAIYEKLYKPGGLDPNEP